MAERVVLPTEAPKPPQRHLQVGIVGTALALVILGVSLAIHGFGVSPGSSAAGVVTSGSPTGSSTIVPAATASLPTPGPTVTPSLVPLPNPGGTCSAGQLVPGQVASAYDFSTFDTRVVFVTLPIRNTGADCVLALPKVIGVASASGAFHLVRVVNGATSTSFQIRSDQAQSVVLGDSWYDTGVLAAAGRTAPPCAETMIDVTRAVFPLAAGSLEFQWDTVWQEVCFSPSRVTATIEK